ncbi:translocation/assembly module TamB domain-containing protein [Rufibacter quisquiliarum]|nr:translocation/assembly module TamB domain-containing protein [Rufibacter quisquiliarum]
MVLVGVLFMALRIPSVQTRVAQKAAEIISEIIDHQVTIGGVDIRFFKSVVLNKVRVLDRQKKTLFYVGELEADIGHFNPFSPDSLYISSLTLTQPEANLIQYKGSDSLNMSTFIRSLGKLITTDTAQAKNPFKFKIDELVLKNGHFTYHDYNEPFSDYGVDYDHLDLERISGRFSELDIKGDTLYGQITNLTTQDKRSGTFLKELDTRMVYAPTFWEWGKLNLRVNNSHLANFVRFDYRRFGNFVHFNDSIEVTANFDSTYVTSDDISMFAEVLKDWDEKVLLSGNVKGKTNSFRAQNVDIRYGKNTHIKGDISADGLPDFRNTFADLHLEGSTLNARDLKRYIPQPAYDIAARAGTIQLEGDFTGFYNDFVANGAFKTPLGNLQSDINLKFDKQNANHSSYSGYVKTGGFDVGGLIGDRSIIRRVALDGRVKGSGFSFETAHLQLDATINAIDLYNYNYRNIVVDADLSRETFNGDLSIKDPNIALTAHGKINLQNNNQIFNLSVQLKRANLKTLGLTDQQIYLETDAKVDFTGVKLDEISGTATFENTFLSYQDQKVAIDSLEVVSHFHDGIRELHVGSELLALRAGGDFQYSTLFADLKTLYEEYRLNFRNDPVALANYYRRKPATPPAPYEVELDVLFRRVNPLLHAFAPEVSLSDFTHMEGSFRNGPTAILSLVGTVDTVYYGKNQFYKNRVDFTSSKLWNSADVLANAVVTSERQRLKGAGDTENLYVEGVWNDRLISFSSNIAQTGTTNRANISGNVAFHQDDIQIVFNRSNINVLDRVWTISPNNTIVFEDSDINFNNIIFSNGPQSITLTGAVSRNPQQLLTVAIQDFQLENLNPLLPDKINGRLNGELLLRDLYQNIIMSSRMTVDSFMVDNLLIGNVTGTTAWDNTRELLNVDVGISRDNQKVLSLTGTYNPDGGAQELDLMAVMDDAQIKIVEPLLKTIMTDMSGTMAGRVRISGKLSGPILKGSVMVTDGSFVFNYLKTKYTFSDRVYFSENDISFRNVRLRDIYNNTAILNGGVFHDGFSNMVLDLKANFTRFMVLNTTREDNPMYFGTAFATGEVTVLGPTSNMRVDIKAKSEKDTQISIPLDNATSLEQQNFISFINTNPALRDTAAATGVAPEKKGLDLSGIRLNFNLDIDENAYLELIFDEKTEDIIRGRGRGNIRMDIDTRGEFSMYGTYEIIQGRYNFTLLGLVNKEFNIRPGGTVTWNGDPLEGLLNITATYTQRVSLEPILALGSAQTQSGITRGRYPVTAVMDLDGPLTTPQIRLNLEFNDTPSLLEDQITNYLNTIRNDEQELNRQVFSLLAFKRLSPQNEFQVAVGDLGSSVGELFSNQFSYWLSQIDPNLEVDIGVSGSGDQVLDDIQLRLSYTFLEGRLRITREGSINNNQVGNSGRTTAIGDLSGEFYLSKSGQLRLRVTHQTTPRDFEANTTATRQTISVLHQANFDNLGELWRSIFPKKIKEPARQIIDEDERVPIINPN